MSARFCQFLTPSPVVRIEPTSPPRTFASIVRQNLYCAVNFLRDSVVTKHRYIPMYIPMFRYDSIAENVNLAKYIP